MGLYSPIEGSNPSVSAIPNFLKSLKDAAPAKRAFVTGPVTPGRDRDLAIRGLFTMYLQRRNGVCWFRKATPLDLVNIIGRAEANAAAADL